MVSGSLQCCVETANQLIYVARLAQETNRSGLHGACPNPILSKTRHENDRYAVTLGNKVVLQVKASQPRHPHIADKARCVVNLIRLKKFIGRGKRGNAVAESAHEALYRVAHGFIVIDDHNHRGFWQVRVPLAARYQVSAALGAGTPSVFQCAGAPRLRHVINPKPLERDVQHCDSAR